MKIPVTVWEKITKDTPLIDPDSLPFGYTEVRWEGNTAYLVGVV